ncbi:SRPBCC family protein [Yinghuangia aomiensis]
MKYTLRAEPIEFVQTAPRRRAWSADLQASPKQVFAALTDDPGTWRGWFPGLTGAHWLAEAPDAAAGAPTHGVGARREIRLVKPVVFHETIMAWEEPSRWAYRVDDGDGADGERADRGVDDRGARHRVPGDLDVRLRPEGRHLADAGGSRRGSWATRSGAR